MDSLIQSRILAEILRLQRWAGGEAIPAARIHGLLHGFETILREESESIGISEELQEKVEDVLQDIEMGKQSYDATALKRRLESDQISQDKAACVMELCLLQSRFSDAISKIATEAGGAFGFLKKPPAPQQDWLGALHFMELVDCTGDAHRKMHAVLGPGVPPVGEIVTPHNGSRMRVVEVEYLLSTQGSDEGFALHCLVPHVYLEIDKDSLKGR